MKKSNQGYYFIFKDKTDSIFLNFDTVIDVATSQFFRLFQIL